MVFKIKKNKDATIQNYDSEQNVKNPNFYSVEDATFTGDVIKKHLQLEGFKVPYLEGFSTEESWVEFTIFIEEESMYHLNFPSYGIGGQKVNKVFIDSKYVADITANADEFADSFVSYVYLEPGKHKVRIEKSWGYFAIKGLEIMKIKPIDMSTYIVDSKLVNPNASINTKRLMSFLTDQYGKRIISGQSSNEGHLGREFSAIFRETRGKTPAILGLDFIDESASRKSRASGPDVLSHAKTFHEIGSIITFMWHWNAPEPYLYDTPEHPWWSSFYTEHTTIDLSAIMNGQDPEGYRLLIEDMDEIAKLLKELADEQIPVLWRPLHEASGGWFWWGASGSQPFIDLWQLMYHRFVNVHGLNNLIWVWNGQGKEWYPGDEFVDIIGEDIYPGKQAYSSQASRFAQAMDYTDKNKLIVLSENGCLPDPDLLERDQVMWGYFTSWNGEFVVDELGNYSEEYTSKEMLNKVYHHKKVLTLEKLPDLSTYPIK
ncbi:glycosyl hydrolase [Jeotgalibaca caeni]|uniref:glycosyl hydrolase n=1 Tax=Jeotgalibaca caeni TaxID=3028623 RepID=UPI00237DDE39|nr:glycosyl hydrolase [Jeotgalibaca caeni]MDE1549969.1 glycosyl hydrolase [Jeotgalibaca caeni]